MKIAVILVLVLIVVGLSGCVIENNTQSDGTGGITTWASRFAGTWESADENAIYIFYSPVTFYSDYTITYGVGVGGYYEVKDGKLVVTRIDGMILSYDFLFSNNDTELTITTLVIDKTATYVKQGFV